MCHYMKTLALHFYTKCFILIFDHSKVYNFNIFICIILPKMIMMRRTVIMNVWLTLQRGSTIDDHSRKSSHLGEELIIAHDYFQHKYLCGSHTSVHTVLTCHPPVLLTAAQFHRCPDFIVWEEMMSFNVKSVSGRDISQTEPSLAGPEQWSQDGKSLVVRVRVRRPTVASEEVCCMSGWTRVRVFNVCSVPE